MWVGRWAGSSVCRMVAMRGGVTAGRRIDVWDKMKVGEMVGSMAAEYVVSWVGWWTGMREEKLVAMRVVTRVHELADWSAASWAGVKVAMRTVLSAGTMAEPSVESWAVYLVAVTGASRAVCCVVALATDSVAAWLLRWLL